MSKIHEIELQLEDTKAAVSRLEQAAASRPESSSLRINLQALHKRQRHLEQQLRKHQEAALPGSSSLE